MNATSELARAVDRAVLENLHEVQGLAGNIRYLNRLRMMYRPGAPMSDVIAREKARKARLEGLR
jgi:hypothetical protein